MDKDKLLLNVALDLKKLADSVSAYVDAVLADPPCEESNNTTTVKVDKTAEQPLTEEELKKIKEKKVLEARDILGKKVTAEAQELVRSYGVQNLSMVALADFDDLIAKAKELTDAPT